MAEEEEGLQGNGDIMDVAKRNRNNSRYSIQLIHIGKKQGKNARKIPSLFERLFTIVADRTDEPEWVIALL